MKEWLLRAWFMAACIAVTQAPPLRAEVHGGESIVVQPGQIVDGNLYGVANTVAVGGDVLGDVIVGGATVVVSGHVRGDVFAVGSTVVVTGRVDGDIRAFGGDVSVSTALPGDAVLLGSTVTLMGRVGGDALVGGGRAAISAPIERTLYLATTEASLSAQVGRNLVGIADRLVLEDGSVVNGDVDYTGNTFELAPGAIVDGAVVHIPAEPQARMVVRTGVTGWLQDLIGLGAFGALWLFLFRGFAQRAMETLRGRPALSLAVGSGVLLGAPLVCSVAFAVGVVAGGWWMSLFGAAIYAMAITITFPLTAALVGRRFLMVPLGCKHELEPMLLVLLAQSLLTRVPVVGPVLSLAIVLFGLGAITLTLVPMLRQARLPSSPEPTTTAPVTGSA
jgi:cytoskeletal protein CcmA (bactofilin family)